MKYATTITAFAAELNALKDSLCVGDLERSRRHLVRASRFCITDEEGQAYAHWAMRIGLLSGRYNSWNDPSGLWQTSQKRWPDDVVLRSLRRALFATAGWEHNVSSVPDLPSLPDLLDLAALPGQTPPEEIWEMLAVQAHQLREQPSLLIQQTLPSRFFDMLGQRILPPLLEGFVAELWWPSKAIPRQSYPRLMLLQELAAKEASFGPTVLYIQCLEALRKHDFSQALEHADRIYRTEAKCMWLRILPLTVYFGTPAQHDALPRRLRQVWCDHFAPAAARPLPAEYRTLAATVVAQMLSLTAADDTHADLAELRETCFPDAAAPLWSVPPCACLVVSALLENLSKKRLPKPIAMQLTLPGLAEFHAFLRAMRLWEGQNLGGKQGSLKPLLKVWNDLPLPLVQAATWQQPLLNLLSALTALPEVIEVVLALQGRGVSPNTIANAVAPALTLDAFLSDVFLLAMPQWDAARIADLQPDVLRTHWVPLLERCLSLDSSLDSIPDCLKGGVTSLLLRLAAADVRPADVGCMDLAKIAARLSGAPWDAAIQTIQFHIARLCGLNGLSDAADHLMLALTSGQAAALTAELWLRTGNAAYLSEKQWGLYVSPWAEAATIGYRLLTLSDMETLDVSALSMDIPEKLRAELVAIQEWLSQCVQGSSLVPFVGQDTAQPSGSGHAAIAPLLLASDANAEVESPLSALIALSREPFNPTNAPRLAKFLLCSYADDNRISHAVITLVIARLARNDASAYDSLLLQCTGMMTSDFRRALSRSLYAVGAVAQAEGLAVGPSTEAAKKLLRLSLRENNEKTIRLLLAQVTTEDMGSIAVWDRLAAFLNSDHFQPFSFTQWDLVQVWRLKTASLDAKLRNDLQADLAEALLPGRQEVLDRFIFGGAVRPALIDINNLILDESIHLHFDDAVDFIELLWQALEADFYPILSFLDKSRRSNNDLAVQTHLQRLIKAGLIDAGAGQTGDASTADYRILQYARQFQADRPVMITNDYYAKAYRADAKWSEPSGWNGHPDFPWLTTHVFDAMAARVSKSFAPMSWDIHIPTENVQAGMNVLTIQKRG